MLFALRPGAAEPVIGRWTVSPFGTCSWWAVSYVSRSSPPDLLEEFRLSAWPWPPEDHGQVALNLGPGRPVPWI